jgi:hypothetical protein
VLTCTLTGHLADMLVENPLELQPVLCQAIIRVPQSFAEA